MVQEYDGQRKVIRYRIRSLSQVENKYSVTEKETLAVVLSYDKFHVYLYEFELVTDHKALEVLYSEKVKLNCRIQRWVKKLL